MTVVEWSAFVAAPLAGMTLAMLGADVVKLQPPQGLPDQGRWPLAENGASLFWRELNKGKRTQVWDFANPDRYEDFVQFLVDNDRVLLLNLPLPDAIGIARLKARIPDLIVLELQGSPDGSSAVDYTVQPLTGFPEATGAAGESNPINSPLPAWDLATGYLSAVSLLAAIDRRRRTGAGAHLRIALTDVALSTMSNLGLMAERALTGDTTRSRTGNQVYGAFGQDFLTGDGHRLMVVAITRRQWSAFVGALGIGDRIIELAARTGLNLDDEGDRFRLRDELRLLCEPWFLSRSFDDIAPLLDEAGVLWSRFRSLADAMADPFQFTPGTTIVETIAHPGIPSVPSAGLPVRLIDEERSATAPSPVPIRKASPTRQGARGRT